MSGKKATRPTQFVVVSHAPSSTASSSPCPPAGPAEEDQEGQVASGRMRGRRALEQAQGQLGQRSQRSAAAVRPSGRTGQRPAGGEGVAGSTGPPSGLFPAGMSVPRQAVPLLPRPRGSAPASGATIACTWSNPSVRRTPRSVSSSAPSATTSSQAPLRPPPTRGWPCASSPAAPWTNPVHLENHERDVPQLGREGGPSRVVQGDTRGQPSRVSVSITATVWHDSVTSTTSWDGLTSASRPSQQ